jgi:hypothetical protein
MPNGSSSELLQEKEINRHPWWYYRSRQQVPTSSTGRDDISQKSWGRLTPNIPFQWEVRTDGRRFNRTQLDVLIHKIFGLVVDGASASQAISRRIEAEYQCIAPTAIQVNLKRYGFHTSRQITEASLCLDLY